MQACVLANYTSVTIKSLAAQFFPMINLAPRNLRQTLNEERSIFTDKCIEYLLTNVWCAFIRNGR